MKRGGKKGGRGSGGTGIQYRVLMASSVLQCKFTVLFVKRRRLQRTEIRETGEGRVRERDIDRMEMSRQKERNRGKEMRKNKDSRKGKKRGGRVL